MCSKRGGVKPDQLRHAHSFMNVFERETVRAGTEAGEGEVRQPLREEERDGGILVSRGEDSSAALPGPCSPPLVTEPPALLARVVLAAGGHLPEPQTLFNK